ncbi:MAG: DUF2809 domain-containing protein [Agriterribacter sp.]
MKNTIKFNLAYFILAILLFIVEVFIALYSHDSILRAYIGDVLVVILIYCMVKAFFDTPVVITAIAVLLFSFVIETLQYFNIVNKLGLQHSAIAKVVIGTSFSWVDIWSYVAGIAIVLIAEKLVKHF